ncbi:MAG: formylglycine-generating enzyme family protein [Candidatus Wallbacteria bacterium]|nr:formylglycine-generating enzyme family protein [Candidatus Wallbacteria bacterium]
MEPGEFEMGSDGPFSVRDERPVHSVTIRKAFWIGKFPVTQEQFEAVSGKNPSFFKGGKLPVDNISWNLCQEFCRELSSRNAGWFRVPTEAEWEFACRSGNSSEFFWGDSLNGDYFWYSYNSSGETQEVGLKKPNAWGIHDMLGNVWEWCKDFYSEDYYMESPETDPVCLRDKIRLGMKVKRGGSWQEPADRCRCGSRGRANPEFMTRDTGFRLIFEELA